MAVGVGVGVGGSDDSSGDFVAGIAVEKAVSVLIFIFKLEYIYFLIGVLEIRKVFEQMKRR